MNKSSALSAVMEGSKTGHAGGGSGDGNGGNGENGGGSGGGNGKPDGLEYYRRLPVIKKFGDCRHAKGVVLLQGGVVRKAYDQRFRETFENEVRKMQRLRGCDFVPQLLAVDKKNLSFYMTYCGSPLERIDAHRPALRALLGRLRKEYGIEHNDAHARNVCLKDGKLYLIDFGWARTGVVGRPGYATGRLGHRDTATGDRVDAEAVREWLAGVLADPQTRLGKAAIDRLKTLSHWS